jgi:transposase
LDARTGHPPLELDAQKKTLTASERDPLERAAFQVRQADQDASDLVIVDEVGSNIDLTRRYARAPAGERAFGSIPRNTPTNLTLIASLQLSGMGPSMLLPGGTDTLAFEAYITEVLAPTLRPGQIVLVDNHSAHKAPRIADVLAKRGCSLWFLPTYSPDLSPIELAFAKIKTILRSIGARTCEALEQAIAQALRQISAAHAASFFRHCGYWIPSPMAQAFRSQL